MKSKNIDCVLNCNGIHCLHPEPEHDDRKRMGMKVTLFAPLTIEDKIVN